MRIRFVTNFILRTVESTPAPFGKTKLTKHDYSIDFGRIVEVDNVEEDGPSTVTITFPTDKGGYRGQAVNIEKDYFEFVADGYIKPMPPDKCCPDKT